MTICDRYHDTVVFEGGRCPLCEANSRIEELEEKVSDKDSDIADLERENRDLQADKDNLQYEIDSHKCDREAV